MKQHVDCGVIWDLNTKPAVEPKESHKNLQTELAFEPTHDNFIILLLIKCSSVTILLTIMFDHIIICV
jgi:hypothetical protein